MAGPFIVRVVSQKGGVGKTVVAINLALSLADHQKKVLLIDADFVTASVSFQIDLDGFQYTYKEVLFNLIPIKKALIRYKEGGIDVLPGKIGNVFLPKNSQLDSLLKHISKLDYDFIVIDTPPGAMSFIVGKNVSAFVKKTNALLVSCPSEASTISNLGLFAIYKSSRVNLDYVLNKFNLAEYPLSLEKIKNMYSKSPMVVLEEEEIVPRSLYERYPAYLLDKKSRFSTSINKLAEYYISKNNKK